MKDKRKNKEIPKYEKLNYVKDIKEIKSKDALDFIFLNDDVKNAAITGNYSSGKSSILFSYIENYLGKKAYKSITSISLATFQSKQRKNTDITIQELEKEIIQQLYYSEYKYINKRKFFISVVMSFFTLLLIYTFLMIFFYNEMMRFFSNNIIKKMSIINTTMIVIFTIIFSKIYEFTSFSLKIDDIEIKTDKGSSNFNNILNMNLSFIFKIFSIRSLKTKYVIFEDLDRFENPIIFEHLRDLNSSLNKTWKVKFIYVLNDDIFKDENRTKFFDFIYPVIPFVSYESSGEILNKLISDKYNIKQNKLTPEFINNITFFVQDMRILKNVLNEYRIYNNELNYNEDDFKILFSILLYKNVFSEDFRKLQNNQGNLYKLLNSKDEIIKKFSKEIEELRNKVDNKKFNISDEKIFCTLIEREIEKNPSNSGKITLKNCTIGSRTLERETNLDYDYISHRDTKIPYNGMTGNLEEFLRRCDRNDLLNLKEHIELERKNKLKETEKLLYKRKAELLDIKNLSISELIKDDTYSKYFDLSVFDDNIQSENIRKKDLILFLLREGLINENYFLYINRSHWGNIKDYEFLRNTMINRHNTFSDQLENPKKIIDRLETKYFKNDKVLNINILKTMFFLDETDYKDKISNFITTFMKSENFIENFKICKDNLKKEEKENIYKIFCKDPNFIEKIIGGKVKDLLIDVIGIVDIDDISINDEFILKEEIEQCTVLLSTQFNEQYDILKKLFITLNIKMKNINLEESERGKLFEYCFKNNMYSINLINIENAINAELGEKNEILLNNYNSIMQTKDVQNYINNNIEQYLDKAYFDKKKSPETCDSIIELLNNKDITKKYKIKIINEEKNKNLIDNISLIQNEELYKYLLDSNLASANYSNIITFLQKSDMTVKGNSNILTNFINLNKFELMKSQNKLQSKESQMLLEFICINENIANDIYMDMIEKLNGNLKKLDIDNLSDDKILILIDTNIIKFDSNMYDCIRKMGKTVFLKYTNKYKQYIRNDITKYNFTNEEISQILSSKEFSNSTKFKNSIIENTINSSKYTFSENFATIIIKYILKNNNVLNLETRTILELLSKCTYTIIKVQLINLYIKKFDKENVKKVLNEELTEYKDLLIDRTRPKYTYNAELKIFIDNLISLNYNIKYEIKDNQIHIKGTVR